MYFVWISEQTAIISLYNINWLVFITETVCLLRGTDWVLKCNWRQSAQQTAHTPFHNMLPHLHTIYDVILLNVLTEM